jgi:Tfp pilus assembly protein FimT
MHLEREAGFTFNELLVTMGIVALVVMSSSVGSLQLIRRQTVSDRSTVAINLAQDKMEELQARRPLSDVDFCPDGGDRGLSAKGGVAGAFNRCWKIAPSDLAADLKQIDVVVSWQDHEAHEMRVSTLVFIGE